MLENCTEISANREFMLCMEVSGESEKTLTSILRQSWEYIPAAMLCWNSFSEKRKSRVRASNKVELADNAATATRTPWEVPFVSLVAQNDSATAAPPHTIFGTEIRLYNLWQLIEAEL